MHPSILGAGPRWALTAITALLALAASARAATPAACPPAAAPLAEVFTAADCAGCWSAPAPATQAAPPGWRLDWITPAGDDAPLSAAALPEAAERARRAASAPAPTGWPPARRLSVVSGPAWNGYLGVQLQLQRTPPQVHSTRLPPGSTGWLALVELLPAGTDGSALPRALVRSVAGPLPLDDRQPTSHLRALRWPDGARPERLQARAWVEAPDGRVLLMAADRCPPP